MENKKPECFECRDLIRYYTKGIKRFNKSRYGWCCKRQEHVDIHDNCENFNRCRKKGIILYSTKICINDLLTQITEIRNILEETANENVQEL